MSCRLFSALGVALMVLTACGGAPPETASPPTESLSVTPPWQYMTIVDANAYTCPELDCAVAFRLPARAEVQVIGRIRVGPTTRWLHVVYRDELGYVGPFIASSALSDAYTCPRFDCETIAPDAEAEVYLVETLQPRPGETWWRILRDGVVAYLSPARPGPSPDGPTSTPASETSTPPVAPTPDLTPTTQPPAP